MRLLFDTGTAKFEIARPCKCCIDSADEDQAVATENVEKSTPVSLEKFLLTVPETAKVLGISRSTTYALLNRGTLRSIQIGRCRRVRVQDIEEFVTQVGNDF